MITGDVDSSRVSYDDGHYDIILQPGVYLIKLHGDNCAIEIVGVEK